MIWIIGLLTVLLVLDCLVLGLLILAQKPKKDTGGGLAFGGAASDALFGAGSGDFLTKTTKYATVIFFVLTLTLSILNAQQSRSKGRDPRERLTAAEKAADLPPTPAPKPAANVASTATNALTLMSAATNLASATASNALTVVTAATNTASKAGTNLPSAQSK